MNNARIKKMAVQMAPPVLLQLTNKIRGKQWQATGDLELRTIEYLDFHANTSLFALEVFCLHGQLNQMRLLGLGTKMEHLADYLALFKIVYHSTMVKTLLPLPAEKLPAKLVLLQGDFFELPPLEVDCVVSDTTIHCLNDTRYGNICTDVGWQRPYQAATKLRQIVGNRKLPVVVSIAVNRDEYFIDGNSHLAHDKFIDSFVQAGFVLREYFFDYLCGGMPQRPEYFDIQYRRARSLPSPSDSQTHYVVGNYSFL